MIGFSAIASIIRDGFPALGSTHAARATGGLVVLAGAAIFMPLPLAIVCAAGVWLGFYADMKHGEANQGDWTAGIVSGCTSLAPLAVLLAIAVSVWWLFAIALGVAKPLIWQAAWALDPGRFASRVPAWAAPLTEPTRIAAAMWGALIGLVLCAVALAA